MKYLLTVKIPFEALDDLQARQFAADTIKDEIFVDLAKFEAKLQRLIEGKPPEKVPLE